MTSRVKVATGNRCPVRSECRNFGRVLRGWPRKCLEEGQVTSRMNVATVKRHPVRSPERVSLEVLGRGTGDFHGECCDGESLSCAF